MQVCECFFELKLNYHHRYHSPVSSSLTTPSVFSNSPNLLDHGPVRHLLQEGRQGEGKAQTPAAERGENLIKKDIKEEQQKGGEEAAAAASTIYKTSLTE